MEGFMATAMQVCTHYAEKMNQGHLCEYEQQMYESMAIMVKSYCRLQDLHIQASNLNAERMIFNQQKEHQKWLEENMPKPGEGE
jgi:hypothetical protein